MGMLFIWLIYEESSNIVFVRLFHLGLEKVYLTVHFALRMVHNCYGKNSAPHGRSRSILSVNPFSEVAMIALCNFISIIFSSLRKQSHHFGPSFGNEHIW